MKTFGILAFPAAHSLSPAMHRAAFEELKIDAEFDFFEIAPENLPKFFEKFRAEKIAGAAVSIPHKTAILKFVDEISPTAQKIGAANTLFWRGEKLVAENTDEFGFRTAIEFMNNGFKPVFQLKKNKTAVVFGAGGAARAVIFALKNLNFLVKIWARENDFAVAENLRENFGAEILPTDFSKINFAEFDLLVNATPVGMHGFADASILPAEFFPEKKVAFDLVMNPRETQFLKIAAAKNCEKIYGEKMLLFQGARQFEIWHERKAPVKIMEKALRAKLEN